MTPKQILDKISQDEIVKMREKYFEMYPEDKEVFDTGIISDRIARRVDKFIVDYYNENNNLFTRETPSEVSISSAKWRRTRSRRGGSGFL